MGGKGMNRFEKAVERICEDNVGRIPTADEADYLRVAMKGCTPDELDQAVGGMLFSIMYRLIEDGWIAVLGSVGGRVFQTTKRGMEALRRYDGSRFWERAGRNK
jgi:hypothetical protein